MLIDWFTVGAQALNFIILVGLMKHFLYRPILDAIDAREKRIANALADASKKKTEAQHERDEFQHKNDAFDNDRAALMTKAQADADTERKKLLDAAHQAADALAAKRQAALADEAKALMQALRLRTQTEVFAIAGRTLGDLATASLEASACEVFIARLRAIEGPPRDALALALKAAPDAVVVRSAFELPPAQRQALHQAIDDVFSVKLDLHCETAPALVGGIELVAGGEKFAWTIADYLSALDRGVDELLKAPAAATP
jgi:F-type H+-transporting ATPase subunit b